VLIEEANTSGNTVVEAQKEHVDNLNGLTEDQVEQLYRDGRITRYEYQQNMESREAAEEAVAANGQQNAELVKETLANEEVVAASQAMITAVDNGNAAVMEAALGINPTDGQQQIQIQAVVR
jgi:nitrate reductase beta subunit